MIFSKLFEGIDDSYKSQNFNADKYATLTDEEKDLIADVANEEGINKDTLEKIVIEKLKERLEAYNDEIDSCKTLDNLSKDELKELRSDITIGSYFTVDYNNRFGLDPTDILGLSDGYTEYIDEANLEDTPENFAAYVQENEYPKDFGLNKQWIKEYQDEAMDYRNNLLSYTELTEVAYAIQRGIIKKVTK